MVVFHGAIDKLPKIKHVNLTYLEGDANSGIPARIKVKYPKSGEILYSISNNIFNLVVTINLDGKDNLAGKDNLDNLDNERIIAIDSYDGKENIDSKIDSSLGDKPCSGKCSRYCIEVLQVKSHIAANISKKAKKTVLNKVTDGLFVYDDSYFVTIDQMGKFSYFPDSLEIYSTAEIDTAEINNMPDIKHILEGDNTNEHTTTHTTALDYILKPTSYSLYDLSKSCMVSNKLSSIDNISNSSWLSWLNPWSYSWMNSSSTCPNTMNATMTNHNDNISLSVNNIKYYFKQSPDKNESLLIIHYIDHSKIKILRSKEINLPFHIIDIKKSGENIVLNGYLEESKREMLITFNKYLLNPIINLA